MSFHTNSLMLIARNIGRALGLNNWIASWLLCGEGYETKYDNLLSTGIRSGDCVWDIGANIGYYTRLFAERVGPRGLIFAFEPSALNFSRLSERCSSLENTVLLQCGLGKVNGRFHFHQGEDGLGTTSRVIDNASDGEVVDIRSGDNLLEEGTVNIPHVIKIDVEGYEWEVLEGIAGVIGQPHLRTIGVEIHFGILKDRGMGFVPQQIERLLLDSGFSITWPDSSHVFGVRNL